MRWKSTTPLRDHLLPVTALLFMVLPLAWGQVTARRSRQLQSVVPGITTSSSLLSTPINEVYCPGGDAISETKENSIHIGVIGSNQDPTFMPSPSSDQCWMNTSEYNSSIPDYLIAIMKYFEQVNTNHSILPFHRLCLVLSLSSSIEESLIWAYSHAVLTDIMVVIDATVRERSRYTQSILLPFSLPVIHFADLQRLSSEILPTIKRGFKCDFKCVNSAHNRINHEIWNDFCFSMIPQAPSVYRAVQELSKLLGWRRLGLIAACEQVTCLQLPKAGLISKNGFDVFVSYYNPTDPLETFQLFIEEEIQIFTFHGSPRVYLDVLLLASKYSFTGPE